MKIADIEKANEILTIRSLLLQNVDDLKQEASDLVFDCRCGNYTSFKQPEFIAQVQNFAVACLKKDILECEAELRALGVDI